jgi:enoyl-CoA hydratase/carnithine racemase
MKSFKYELKDGIGTITLSRPDKLNALTFQIYRDLTDFFAAEKEARVLVITGEGRGFCSGGDVNDIIGPLLKMDMKGLLDFTRMTCDLVKNIRLIRKPVIAAVNGVCAGAGAAIATACDVRFVSETAKFAFLFNKVGLSGADMGATFLLPRIVGFGRAAELLLTGAFFDAAEAYRIGFANRVCKDLMSEAQSFAASLAKGPAFGTAMTKEMMNRELSVGIEQALEWEAQAQSVCMQTPDFHEAFQAFIEKREPRFK